VSCAFRVAGFAGPREDAATAADLWWAAFRLPWRRGGPAVCVRVYMLRCFSGMKRMLQSAGETVTLLSDILLLYCSSLVRDVLKFPQLLTLALI
jgi:hypothetical protein